MSKYNCIMPPSALYALNVDGWEMYMENDCDRFICALEEI